MTPAAIIAVCGVSGVVVLLLMLAVLRLDGARRRHAVRRRANRRKGFVELATAGGDYDLRRDLDEDGAYPRGCP